MNYYYNLLVMLGSLPVLFVTSTLGYFVSSRLGLLEKSRFQTANLGIGIVVGNSILSLLLIPLLTLTQLNGWTAGLLFAVLCLVAGFIWIRKKPQVQIKTGVYFCLFAILSFLHFLRAAMPEVSWDALAYHLPLTKSYSLSYAASLYAALPKGMDILFWFGEALFKNYTLSKMFHVSYLIAMALFAHAAVSELTEERFGKVAALLILSYHLSFDLAHTCYVDVATACLEIIAIFSTMLWIRTAETNYFRVVCFALGAALSIKYTALVPAALLLSTLAAFSILSRTYRSALSSKNVLISFVLFAVPCAYWYTKNLIVLGNPLWPFYFGHRGMTETAYLGLIYDNLEHYTFKRTFANFLLIPYRLFTNNFESYALQGLDLSVRLSVRRIEWAPVFLVCMLFYKDLYRRKDLLFMVMYYVAIFTINFWFGSHQVRYVLSNFYLGMLFVCFFGYFLRSERAKKIFSVFIVCLVFFQNGSNPFRAFRLFAKPDLVEFMTSSLHDYPLVEYKHVLKIPAKECGYMFEIISRRYIPDYEDLRDGYVLRVDLIPSSATYAEVKQYLADKGISYWLTNTQTTAWRKDWLARHEHMPKEKGKTLKHMIDVDELILKSGKVLKTDSVNSLIEL